MNKDTFWMFAFCLSTVEVLTERLLPEHKIYVTDAQFQNEYVIKTWTFRGSSLAVTVTKGNKTLLSDFFNNVSSMEQKNRLFIKYNNSREEVSLLLDNVTRDDEGLYKISSGIVQKATSVFDVISDTWHVQLNILEPSEIKQGSSGENILITELLQGSIFFPRLYHNDQLIAVLRDSDCDVSIYSPFYGRIRCSKDTDNNTTRIEINHVTENDTGLYTVKTESNLTQRCFLNITGTYINSVSALPIVTWPGRFDENNSDQPSNITLSTTVLSGTNVIRASLLCVPVYVFAVIIGVVGFIHLIGCLIWGQRKKIHITKTEQNSPQDECVPGLYLTPISLEPPLTLPTCQERKTGHSSTAQNKTVYQRTRSIDMAQMLSMDGYEVVDISKQDPATIPELEEIIYESTTVNCNTSYGDTTGYLTVLTTLETTV